jgi:hypothetical protein
MQLNLQREESSPKSTPGKLYIDGTFECYTLEDVVREIPGRPVSEWKIKKETAIPVGKYRVIITPSPKRKGRLMPLLLNVPGFAGIQIHSGNDAEDTEGCILLGTYRESADIIRGSTEAFRKFFEKLKAALDKSELVTIEISSKVTG